MNTESAAAPPPALQAFGRIPIFYGWAYPIFAIAGFLVARRRLSSSAVRVLAAYGIAFLMLVFLRAFGRGLFRDLKEITFAVPLVAILTALTLTELLRRGRAGKLATACVLVGLTIFGLSKYQDYLKTYASVVLRVQEAPEARTLPPSG